MTDGEDLPDAGVWGRKGCFLIKSQVVINLSEATIFLHAHPSGDLKSSEQELSINQKLRVLAKL